MYRGERGGNGGDEEAAGLAAEVEEQPESRIVVLPFYHPAEARTTSQRRSGDGDFVSFHSRSVSSSPAGFILNETLRGLNSACRGYSEWPLLAPGYISD